MVSLTLVDSRWAVMTVGTRPAGTFRYVAAIGKQIRPPRPDERTDSLRRQIKR